MSDSNFKIEVSQRIGRLPPYLFGRINKMKYEKRVAGVDIIDLGMGNPTDPTPDSVVEKLAEAAKDNGYIAHMNRCYESFKEHQDAELCELAWLWNLNRGIFMTPGREEEWTLSVTHTDEDVDHFVSVFDELAAALTA